MPKYRARINELGSDTESKYEFTHEGPVSDAILIARGYFFSNDWSRDGTSSQVQFLDRQGVWRDAE